jgi:hypothetical protein
MTMVMNVLKLVTRIFSSAEVRKSPWANSTHFDEQHGVVFVLVSLLVSGSIPMIFGWFFTNNQVQPEISMGASWHG